MSASKIQETAFLEGGRAPFEVRFSVLGAGLRCIRLICRSDHAACCLADELFRPSLIIQMLAILIVMGITGFEWLASGLYLKFCIVFGSGLAMLILAFFTKSPIFILAFGAIAIGGALWN